MNKRRLALIFVIALGLFLSSSNYEFQLTTVHAGDWEEVDHIDSMDDLITEDQMVIEGELVSQSFALAASSTNFVDATQVVTYGIVTAEPPAGMGVDDAAHTTLQEESYLSYGYPTVTSYTGGALPAGWSNTNWVFGATYTSIIGMTSASGNFRTGTYDMSAYTGVRVSFQWRNTGSLSTEEGELWCRSYETGNQDWFSSPAGFQSSYKSEQRDSGWDSTGWYVQWYATGLTGDIEAYEGFQVDNIYLYGQTTDTYWRFEAVYRFDTVTHTYATERLYIDYDAGTSQEGLSYYAGITTNPTEFIGGTSGAEPDTSFDVHDELTGTPFYVKIRDLTRNDGDQDSWLIDRLYLTVTNIAPTNDGTPTIAVLDDTDNLYSRYRKYEITTYHKDLDGYDNIDYVVLAFENVEEELQFFGSFDQDTHIFLEMGTTEQKSYWELDTAGSTYSEHDTYELDITWKFYVEWACPDIVNINLYCYVVDPAPESDSDDYPTTWDIETDLEYDVIPTITADDAGEVDRGDLDETFYITGDVSYQGSALTPPSGDVDVWVSMTVGGWGTNVGPWEDDTVDAGGTFNVTCYADDEVGNETYTIKVVREGTGYGGTDLIDGADPIDVYIADEIEVYYSTVSDARTNIDEQEWPLFRLRLKYDNHLLNDGTNDAVQINGSAATWSAGDSSWYKYYTQTTVGSWNFLATSASENTYGIIAFDSSSAVSFDADIIWDSLTITITGPTDNRQNLNANASGIVVSAVRDYDSSVFDGTFTLNNTDYNGDGTVVKWGYTVSSASGGSYGITAISTNDDTYMIWDAIGVNMWISDGRDNIDDTITVYAWLSYMYDRTNVTDGTVLLNGSAMSYGSSIWSLGRSQSTVGLWAYNITSISGNTHGITEIGYQYTDGSDDYIRLTDLDAYNSTEWTRVISFRVNELTGGIIEEVFRHGLIFIVAYRGDLGTPRWEIGFQQTDATPKYWNPTSLPIGEWVHIVLTGDGTNWAIYWNGTYQTGGEYDGTLRDLDSDIWIGAYGTIYEASRFINATYGEIRYYNRSLSAVEVYELYQGRHSDDTGMVLDLHMASLDYADATWYDLSCYGNDGTIYGSPEITNIGAYTDYLYVRPIWDRIRVILGNTIDARTNVDEQEYPFFRLVLEYDWHYLNDGTNDGVWINGSSATWYNPDTYWYKFYTMETVGSWNFLVTSASEDTYGITAFDSSSATTYDIDIIWDEIEVYYHSTNDNRVNVDGSLNVIYQLRLKYDNHLLDDGTNDEVWIESVVATWSVPSSAWYNPVSHSAVGTWPYKVTSASEDTYGITAFDAASATTHTNNPIWDRVQVYFFEADDYRASVDANVEVRVRAWLEYDKHNLTSGDSVSVNGTALSWDAGNEWFEYSFSQSTVGRWCYNVTSLSEATYGINVWRFFTGSNPEATGVYVSTDCPTDSQTWSFEHWYMIEEWGCDAGTITTYKYNVEGSFGFIMPYRNSGDASGSMRWYLTWNNTANEYAAWSYALTDHVAGVWYHTVATGNSTGYVRFYRNGAQFYAGQIGPDFKEYRIGNDYDINFHVYGGGAYYPLSHVDKARYYERELSAAEVYQHYHGVFSNNANLLGRWDFDGNLTDLSGNGYDGSIIGGDYEVTSEGSPLYIVWDRVYMNTWTTYDQRDDVGDSVINDGRFWLEYDDYSLQYSGSGQYTCEGAYMTWADGSEKWYRTLNYAYVHNETVTISAVNELTFDITVFTNTTWATWIVWDRILIVTTTTDDARIDYDTQATIAVTAELEYDGHALGSGDTLYMNGTAMSWNGTHFILNPQFAEVDQWNFFVNSTSANEATYGITVINLDGNSVNQIWDRVNVDMAVNMTWTVIGYYANVSYTGTYEYDSTAWSGYATIANTSLTTGDAVHYEELTFATVVNKTFYATAIEDAGEYGITVLSSTNTVWCVWDDVIAGSEGDMYWHKEVGYSRLIWGEVSTWKWQFNDSWIDNTYTLHAYSNSSTPEATGGIYGSGNFGGFVVGPYDVSWYYVNLTVNCEVTINGNAYDWEIWNLLMAVDIMHTIYIENFEIEPTDYYFWIAYQSNWNNATMMIWDALVNAGTSSADTILNGTLQTEGMYHWSRSTIVGTHNVSILINGSASALDEQNKDFSLDDAWWWYNFTYVIVAADIEITTYTFFGATSDFDYMQYSGYINYDCTYNISEWSASWAKNETHTGSVSEGMFNIAWNKIGVNDVDANFTIVFVNGSLSLTINGFYGTAYKILRIDEIDVDNTEESQALTNITVNFYTNKDVDYYVYDRDDDDAVLVSGSSVEGSDYITWAKNVIPHAHYYAVKWTDGVTNIWYNASYWTFEENIDSLPKPQIDWDARDARRTIEFWTTVGTIATIIGVAAIGYSHYNLDKKFKALELPHYDTQDDEET